MYRQTTQWLKEKVKKNHTMSFFLVFSNSSFVLQNITWKTKNSATGTNKIHLLLSNFINLNAACVIRDFIPRKKYRCT